MQCIEIMVGILLGIGIGWLQWYPYKQQAEYYKDKSEKAWKAYLDLLDRTIGKDIDKEVHQMD